MLKQNPVSKQELSYQLPVVCDNRIVEKTIIRRLYGNPLETLLATWGVSLILQQFVRSVPLAYGAGIVLTLIVGYGLPMCIPNEIYEKNTT